MEQKNIQSETKLKPATTPATHDEGLKPTKPIDKILFVSDDQLFVVKQLVNLAQRYPYSDYPCIVMQGFPAEHERIRRIRGGGTELMLTHQEFEAVIDSLNAVSVSQGKGQLYRILKRIPPKTREHRRQWRRFNENRLAKRPNWSQGKRGYWRRGN